MSQRNVNHEPALQYANQCGNLQFKSQNVLVKPGGRKHARPTFGSRSSECIDFCNTNKTRTVVVHGFQYRLHVGNVDIGERPPIRLRESHTDIRCRCRERRIAIYDTKSGSCGAKAPRIIVMKPKNEVASFHAALPSLISSE